MSDRESLGPVLTRPLDSSPLRKNFASTSVNKNFTENKQSQQSREVSANQPATFKSTLEGIKDRNAGGPRSQRDDPKNETLSVKQKSLKNARIQEINRLAKHNVMLKFMDSMESRFGVSPTRLVGAMTKLKQIDLKKTPEENVSQIVDNFHLNPLSEKKATVLFKKMLSDLNEVNSSSQKSEEAEKDGENDPEKLTNQSLAGAAALMNQDLAKIRAYQNEKANLINSLGNATLEDGLKIEEEGSRSLTNDELVNSATGLSLDPTSARANQLQFEDALYSPYGSQERFILNREKKLSLNENIDRLNDSFFLNSKNATQLQQQGLGLEQEQGLEVAALSAGKEMDGSFSPSKVQDSSMDFLKGDTAAGGLSEGAEDIIQKLRALNREATYLQKVINSPSTLSSSSPLSSASQSSASLPSSLGNSLSTLSTNEGLKDLSVNAGSLNSLQDSSFSPIYATAGLNPLMSSGNFQSEGSLGEWSSSDDEASSFDLSKGESLSERPPLGSPEVLDSFQSKLNSSQNVQSTLNTGAPGLLQKSDSENSNVQNLTHQMEYMIKKGGGEAILKLEPEGLGQIHIKLAMNDGRLSIDMATSSNEAKSLIESSLDHLRSSLETHNLRMDHLKVDVGSNLKQENSESKQNLNQGQNNNGSWENNQARQFFNQFRDSQSSLRDSYYESPEIKGYGQKKSLAPLTAAPEANSTKRFLGQSKGAGLNLVA